MALSYLEQVGRTKDMFNGDISKTPVGEVFSKWIDLQIATMKEKQTRNGNGSLDASISFQNYKIEGKNISVEFIANDYWDYINSGVNGLLINHGAPYSFAQKAKTQSTGINFIESLKLWIQSKGIFAEYGNYDGLAFSIMRSVKNKGIAPNHFVDDTFTEESIEQLSQDILTAFATMLT